MTEVLIPRIDILENQPLSSTVLKFVVEYGFLYGLTMTKPARVEVDSIRYEFYELQHLLGKDTMKIKIIQRENMMDQKRFDEISEMIFKRLKSHGKDNTSCILPIIDKHLDHEKCIPILDEVSEEFGVDPKELGIVLSELVDTGSLFIVPNKSGRWGMIICKR